MRIMNKRDELLTYETPMVNVIRVEVEKGFAVSDHTGTGDDFSGGWG